MPQALQCTQPEIGIGGCDELVPTTKFLDPSYNTYFHSGLNGLSNDPRDPLNIIIPIGGVGSRFQREGYRFPKPLINIAGRPMLCCLLDRLEVCPDDTVWIAVNEDIESQFGIGQTMRNEFPRLDIRLLNLKYLTKGAAETLFIVAQSMGEEHRQRRTVSLDCDTIYFTNILQFVRELPIGHGGCVYFNDEGTDPIYSYIRTDGSDRNLIVELQEKKAISSKANTGAYIFPAAETLRVWASKVLDSRLAGTSPQQIGDEYYTSHLIATMIGDIPFVAIPISTSDFSCVGTPSQLNKFLLRIKNEPSLGIRKRRFCFDLDQTLVGLPQTPGDYSTCPPIWKNIELVRELHKAGHYVIIQTARRMRTHGGNIGAVIADVGCATFKSLETYDIPYDEIFFGKPWAHVYIDDLAVNANLDTFRETGWLTEDFVQESPFADSTAAQKAGVIASRPFNHVQIVGDLIIKSSHSEEILGEMYFYANIPDQLTVLFPAVYSMDLWKETSTYSLAMQRLTGVTYSHLLVGRALTPGRLQAFLSALYHIHTSSSSTTCSLHVNPDLAAAFHKASSKPKSSIDIYANYNAKIQARYTKYRADYDALGVDASATASTILARLQAYQDNQRAIRASVIHGDPVFSNAILDESEGKVQFFDVRCRLGDELTTEGDLMYDLAKVLQSLQGYDHVLLSASKASSSRLILEREDLVLLQSLQEQFWVFVERHYGEGVVRRQDVVDIMASLIFSLIPLHRLEVRPIFLDMCKNVLTSGRAWDNGTTS